MIPDKEVVIDISAHTVLHNYIYILWHFSGIPHRLHSAATPSARCDERCGATAFERSRRAHHSECGSGGLVTQWCRTASLGCSTRVSGATLVDSHHSGSVVIPSVTKLGGGGGYIGIGLSVCLSVRMSHLCPEDVFRTNKLRATKLGVMVHHHDLECHAKRLGSYLQWLSLSYSKFTYYKSRISLKCHCQSMSLLINIVNFFGVGQDVL